MMCHPFRRYCYVLAERFGVRISEVLCMPSDEISEWMAFDLTKNEEWHKRHTEQRQLEEQRALGAQEKANLFKRLLGGSS